MAAHPFGAAPRIFDYIRWAQKQGCVVQTGYSQDFDGSMCTCVRFVAPSGRWANYVGDQDDWLFPSTVDWLDRRLGLESPFGGLPKE